MDNTLMATRIRRIVDRHTTDDGYRTSDALADLIELADEIAPPPLTPEEKLDLMWLTIREELLLIDENSYVRERCRDIYENRYRGKS